MFKNKLYIIAFGLLFLVGLTFSQNNLIDYEGNEYETIRIGEQVWMAENLNSLLDSNGDTIESYCFYNDSSYCKRYGRLYPWTSLNLKGTEGIHQGICPDGWHIPSDEEWSTMIKLLGGINDAGSKLKDAEYPAFNIQYGGNYNPQLGIFSYIDDHTYFWTSTKFSNSAAWMRQLGLYNKNINRSTVPIIYAFSVRCIKD